MLKRIAVILLLLLPAAAHAETRLALIVTNAAYPYEVGKLANPHKDGDLIAAALKTVGFANGNITVIRGADQTAMRLAMAEFIERVEKAGPDAVAFFYYSGHSAADRTERGENYLTPVGAKITLAKQLPILGVSLTEIIKSLERVSAKARFVVIDACRNVGFTKGVNYAAKGFIRSPHLDGIIVAFATRPGDTAEDDNVYPGALASILPTPGLEAEQVFKETQRKVADLSKGLQIPWTEDGLLTRFKFNTAIGTPLLQAPSQPIVALEQISPPVRCDCLETMVGNENRCLKPGAGKTDWFKDCPTCPDMVVVPEGIFKIGSPNDEPERQFNEYQVQVTIAAQFAVGRFAVTRGEFAAFVTATGHKSDGGCFAHTTFNTDKLFSDLDRSSRVAKGLRMVGEWTLQADCDWRSPGFTQTDRHPAVCINWDDAKAYVAWLVSTTGKSYRLLSDSEREYVARAHTTTPFRWGAEISPTQANYVGTAVHYGGGGSNGEWRKATVPVSSFAANPRGLYNVHGNVWEWTKDCWNGGNTGNPGYGSARTTGDCSRRVLRGDSWFSSPSDLRSTFRIKNDTIGRMSIVSFRVARTL